MQLEVSSPMDMVIEGKDLLWDDPPSVQRLDGGRVLLWDSSPMDMIIGGRVSLWDNPPSMQQLDRGRVLLKASSPIEINNGGMILHFLGLPNVNISFSDSLLDVDSFAGGGCLVGFCNLELNLKGLFNGCWGDIGVG